MRSLKSFLERREGTLNARRGDKAASDGGLQGSYAMNNSFLAFVGCYFSLATLKCTKSLSIMQLNYVQRNASLGQPQ